MILTKQTCIAPKQHLAPHRLHLRPNAAGKAPLATAVVEHAASSSSRSGRAAGSAGATLLAGLLLLSSGPAAAAGPIAVLEGAARIVDGDTLYVAGEKVRLYAVDAPEKTQACSDSKGRQYPCGQISWEALKQRVGSNPVRCEVKTKDQYGRNVAACKIMSARTAEDMGTWLVSNGYAVAYKQFGKDYVVLEDKAHSRHMGIWQGEFTEPALWRKQQKAASLAAATAGAGSALPVTQPLPGGAASSSSSSTAPGAASYAAVAAGLGQQQAQQVPVSAPGAGAAPTCSQTPIKGNINAKGEKIYHTPVSGSYMRVEIDERQGERYFCSEQEAAAAGWRPAKK